MTDAQKWLEALKRKHPAADETHLALQLIEHDPALVEEIIADWIKIHLAKIDFDTADEMISRERRLLPLD
jgi:hypothetical protein